MIQQQTSIKTIASDGLEGSTMGINADKIALISGILRDGIYKDKIGAVVREYVTNALDEHTKHGINRPVEVGIRGAAYYGPAEFYVRDFAAGLSDYDIRNVFGMYLESTKTGTNDLTGAFGVGSKSAMAYTDSFTVISNYQGTKTTYLASLDAESGVSISKIFKMAEEPTEETGIEITVSVKRGDYHKFSAKIDALVQFCSASIIAHYDDKVVEPCEPVETRIVDGITYRFFEQNVGRILFQMGNINYLTKDFNDLSDEMRLPKHTIVVDVPIGIMTIPISREGFNETRKNQEVIDRIDKVIINFAEDDLQEYKNLTVSDLLANRAVGTFAGKYFTIKKSAWYREQMMILEHLNKMSFDDNAPDFEKEDGKVVVAVIPNNKAHDLWSERLEDYCSNENKQFYCINAKYFDRATIHHEIADYFVFKGVKTKYFNLKKDGMVDKTKYSVINYYGGGGRYSKTTVNVNPLELHNMVRSRLGLEEANDLEEAAIQMDEMVFTEFSEIELFSFSSDISKYTHIWTIRSQKMRKQMQDIGWFENGSVEYLAAREPMEKVLREKQNAAKMLETAVDFHPVCQKWKSKVRARLNKFPRHVGKMASMVEQIKAENSLRAKIIASWSSSYYNQNKFSRHDLRTILKLK